MAAEPSRPSGATTIPNYALWKEFVGHTKPVSCLKFNNAGNFLATGSSDRSVRIWGVEDGRQVTHLRAHKLGINDLAWSPDGRYIATASDDTCVKVWDTEGKKQVRMFKGHNNYVFCTTFSPQGTHVASGSFDETVRIWDMKAGICARTIPAHSDPVSAVSYNRFGTLLATSSYDGLIRVWDANVGTAVKTLVDIENPPVSFVRFSPNGKYILSACMDANPVLKLWDLGKAKTLKQYVGHKHANFCNNANFSVTGGKWIVSGSEDGDVVIWNLQTTEIVQKFHAHDETIIMTDCHPKQNVIASCAMESAGMVRLWRSDF